MAEQQRPGVSGRASAGSSSSTEWSLEGGYMDGYGDGGPGDGLGDTVVKMPRISGQGWDSTDHAAPGSGGGDGRTGGSSTRTGAGENRSNRGEQVSVPTAGSSRGAVAAVPSMAAPPIARPSGATQPIPAVSAKPAKVAGQARRTRKARLRVSRVDPWSVMKTVFLFSVSFGIMGWVATYLLWQVLLASGLFDAVNAQVAQIIANPSNTEGWRIEDYVSANKVLGVAALLAVINTVITTALGTLGAFLYNLSANILGGLELTLAED